MIATWPSKRRLTSCPPSAIAGVPVVTGDRTERIELTELERSGDVLHEGPGGPQRRHRGHRDLPRQLVEPRGGRLHHGALLGGGGGGRRAVDEIVECGIARRP